MNLLATILDVFRWNPEPEEEAAAQWAEIEDCKGGRYGRSAEEIPLHETL